MIAAGIALQNERILIAEKHFICEPYQIQHGVWRDGNKSLEDLAFLAFERSVYKATTEQPHLGVSLYTSRFQEDLA